MIQAVFGVVFLLLGLINGFYVGRYTTFLQTKIISPLSPTPIAKPTKAQKITPTPSNSPKIVKTPAMQTAENYFSSFTTCLKNPPSAAQGNVSVYCEIHDEFAGKNLEANLKGEYAPVVCGQNPPITVIAQSESTASTVTSVSMKYSYGATSQIVEYQLQKEEDVWKVENIMCPKPS